MDKRKKLNESEMGSGDSDDEFYNVKLPCTPTETAKSCKKVEVKKVYSPPRTKVQYDYKFDSSSDEDSENIGGHKSSKSKESAEKNSGDNKSVKEEGSKENKNLPQSTFKVVEKINEELKNMKNTGGKAKADNDNSGQNNITSMASGVKVSQSQLGIVPPVVVMPPTMVVPQASVMNMGPMIVPSPIGMAGQNIMTMLPSQNMMSMGGNMLRGANAMGGLITTPGAMMGMNAMPGMMGNVMGLQGSMLNPAAVGSINMAMQGNMMRVGAGNAMLRLQTPGNNLMGMQGNNNMMGISRPNGNVLGVPRPVNIPPPPPNLMGNTGGMVVGPGGLMVMGGMVANPNVVSANQSNVNAAVRMMNNGQGNSAVRPTPPPFIRGKPPPPGSFRWQAPRLPKTGSSRSSPNVSSPASSPVDKDNKDYDGDELSTDDKDNSSDKSPTLDTDESQSPPREMPNTFKNDGSFMELFKKMKEESSQEGKSSSDKPGETAETSEPIATLKKPTVMLSGIVGKRRGGRVLKTGLVKKVKKESDQDEEKHPKDAWSMYMAEVKKYREASCEEEGKTRPLVK